MTNCTESLDDYLVSMGEKKTLEIVHFSLAYIVQRNREISDALLSSQKKLAADCAHKATGSVRFYGTPRLEALLLQVRDTDYSDGDIERLRSDLSSEFTLATNTLKQWLANHQ